MVSLFEILTTVSINDKTNRDSEVVVRIVTRIGDSRSRLTPADTIDQIEVGLT
jgi:hypothetical protein